MYAKELVQTVKAGFKKENKHEEKKKRTFDRVSSTSYPPEEKKTKLSR